MELKRIQLLLPQNAIDQLEKIRKEVNTGFDVGSIGLSDVATEIIMSAEIDVKEIRIKHINVKRYLKHLAKDDNIDIDTALKTLQELRSQLAKKTPKVNKNQAGDEA